MVNLFFGFRVHDTQCGAKLFRKDVIKKILPKLGVTQWAFDVDILFHVRMTGNKIIEIPTVWRDAAGSKVQVAKASAEMALAMIRLRILHSPFRWVVTLYNKWIRPVRRLWSRFRANDLLFHSSILFVSMMTVHVCNILFQMVIGRVLPETEYALLAAFLGVLAIIQRPLTTLRTAVCHYGSLLDQEGRRGDAKRLLRKWLILTSIPAILAGLGAILFSETLAAYFHLDRSAPVIIAGALLPALCWLPILNGAAQGLQKFGWTSMAAFVGALGRLFLGAGFTMVLCDACGWAMLGHGLGIYVNVGILFIGLWLALHGRETSSSPLPSMHLYLFQSFFVVAAYSILLTADVVLVKHFLPADLEFSKAATVGRMVVFLPSAIVVSMFPKVASKGTLSSRQKSLFLKSFVYTVVFTGSAVAVCFLLPGLLARILFGIAHASGYLKLMIGTMSAVMALNALLNVVVQFLLAQRRFKACLAVVVSAVVYLVAVQVFHASAWQIVLVAGLSNLAALGLGCVAVARLKTEPDDR
jgi:O-antigen/teichoic acid export membrane protein